MTSTAGSNSYFSTSPDASQKHIRQRLFLQPSFPKEYPAFKILSLNASRQKDYPSVIDNPASKKLRVTSYGGEKVLLENGEERLVNSLTEFKYLDSKSERCLLCGVEKNDAHRGGSGGDGGGGVVDSIQTIVKGENENSKKREENNKEREVGENEDSLNLLDGYGEENEEYYDDDDDGNSHDRIINNTNDESLGKPTTSISNTDSKDKDYPFTNSHKLNSTPLSPNPSTKSGSSLISVSINSHIFANIDNIDEYFDSPTPSPTPTPNDTTRSKIEDEEEDNRNLHNAILLEKLYEENAYLNWDDEEENLDGEGGNILEGMGGSRDEGLEFENPAGTDLVNNEKVSSLKNEIISLEEILKEERKGMDEMKKEKDEMVKEMMEVKRELEELKRRVEFTS